MGKQNAIYFGKVADEQSQTFDTQNTARLTQLI